MRVCVGVGVILYVGECVCVYVALAFNININIDAKTVVAKLSDDHEKYSIPIVWEKVPRYQFSENPKGSSKNGGHWPTDHVDRHIKHEIKQKWGHS